MEVQRNPALTDFRGPTNFICNRRNSVLANYRKLAIGTNNEAEFFLEADPLERGSTVNTATKKSATAKGKIRSNGI